MIMGNDEFILYIRKQYPDCLITNDQLGKKIWEQICQLDPNARQVAEDQSCYWNDGSPHTFMDALRLPKTATQFSFDPAILPRLYAYLDQLGTETATAQNGAGSSSALTAPMIHLRRNLSTVKLELDLDDLWRIFGLLAAHEQTDLLRRYLVQLHNEEFLDEDEAAAIAAHYQIAPPRFR